MNARTQVLELNVEQSQVDEAILSLFHTLLFHRSTGKFHYTKDDTFSIGTVGFTDIECDLIDFTYVRCNSDALDKTLRSDVSSFSQAIQSPSSPLTGQISLEFYQRKRGRWPFSAESSPWEVWTVRVEVVPSRGSDTQRQAWRESVGEQLGDHVVRIARGVTGRGGAHYAPAPPTATELDLVYDTSFTDVQPFLFKVGYSVSPSSTPSVSMTVKRLLRETLSFS